MASTRRLTKPLALLLLLAPFAVRAQETLTDLPTLGATTTTAPSTTTGASSTETGSTTTASTDSSSSSASFYSLSGLPTTVAASVPTLAVPNTSNAPYMQKEDVPEGTVFIAVGAVLGFLLACVLAWRILVAWSVNRSVRRSAAASTRGSEKASSTWGGYSARSGGGGGGGGGYGYKEFGSNLSLDALNSSGKPLGRPHFRDHDHSPARKDSPGPPNNPASTSHHHSNSIPSGLFFSPTAQAQNRRSTAGLDHNPNRSSTFLPAGYYGAPSAANPTGTTTLGGHHGAPYARVSAYEPSPPSSPALRAQQNVARDGYGAPAHLSGAGLYAQPSRSSLMVGQSVNSSESNLPGSRAPSAYLDDLFEGSSTGGGAHHGR